MLGLCTSLSPSLALEHRTALALPASLAGKSPRTLRVRRRCCPAAGAVLRYCGYCCGDARRPGGGQRGPASSAEHAVGGEAGRRPVLLRDAERKAALGKHFLDLGERLLAQVRGLEQLDLGLLDQVADVVDALGLQ